MTQVYPPLCYGIHLPTTTGIDVPSTSSTWQLLKLRICIAFALHRIASHAEAFYLSLPNIVCFINQSRKRDPFGKTINYYGSTQRHYRKVLRY